MKICKTCKVNKEDSAFSDHRRACKSCRCEAQKAIYREDPEARKAYNAASRRYHANNRERLNAASRRYHANHRERQNEISREYAANNRPKINKSAKHRYNSDPLFKLTQLLRCRVRDALAGKSKKSAKTTELLGAPWVWVEAYLEEQFQPGMSWENHGPVWHIDHIRPCSSFDLADPEQQRMCFHWTNLQPLFALDNFRKSDKYDPQTA